MPPSYRRSLISVVAVLAFGVPVVVAPNALASRTAKASHLGDRPLRSGASGPDVRELQQALGKAGFKVKVDGNFGTGTLRAVKRFQRASRLEPSGTVGTRTVKALKRALRGSSANANGGFSDNPNDDGAHHSLGDRIPVKRGMSGHDIRVLQDFLTPRRLQGRHRRRVRLHHGEGGQEVRDRAEPPRRRHHGRRRHRRPAHAGRPGRPRRRRTRSPRSWRPATRPRSAPTDSPSRPPARRTRSRRSSPRATRSPASPTSTAAATASGTTRATTARARSPTRCTAPGCSTSPWPPATSRAGATRAPASG